MLRMYFIALLGFIYCGGAVAKTQLWLSDQPPEKSLLKSMQRSHGGFVHVENDVYVKQLWLRKGDSLFKSTFAEPASDNFRVMDTQQNVAEPTIEHGANTHSIRFKMPDEGYYNAYYTERAIENGILTVATAKAEVLKHSCRLGHNYDRKLVNPNQWNDASLEIVRLRLPEEDFHTRIQSGNRLKFSVLHKGQPVEGAQVTLETQQGWLNTSTTDQNGIASFQVIQDNFPLETNDDGAEFIGKPKVKTSGNSDSPWARNHSSEHASEHAASGSGESKWGGDRAARQQDTFLVHAEYTHDEAGEFDGQPYRQIAYSVSMTGSYSPNVHVDQSKSLGLVYASTGFLILGIGTTVYRRRRIKPFKEVGFDET